MWVYPLFRAARGEGPEGNAIRHAHDRCARGLKKRLNEDLQPAAVDEDRSNIRQRSHLPRSRLEGVRVHSRGKEDRQNNPVPADRTDDVADDGRGCGDP